jgi:GNAT superfamily N-acetyltransferase
MEERSLREGDWIIRPVMPPRWEDLERLFGPDRTCAGCWCMWWRLKRAEFVANGGAGNHLAMRAIVASGQAPGLLAYAGDEPVGWVSVGPRAAYPVLQRSPVLKPVDDTPTWSVVCFFVAEGWRGRGLMAALLRGAVAWAVSQGATAIEGYPVEPDAEGQRVDAGTAYRGLRSLFAREGFQEIARRKPRRPIMRKAL